MCPGGSLVLVRARHLCPPWQPQPKHSFLVPAAAGRRIVWRRGDGRDTLADAAARLCATRLGCVAPQGAVCSRRRHRPGRGLLLCEFRRRLSPAAVRVSAARLCAGLHGPPDRDSAPPSVASAAPRSAAPAAAAAPFIHRPMRCPLPTGTLAKPCLRRRSRRARRPTETTARLRLPPRPTTATTAPTSPSSQQPTGCVWLLLGAVEGRPRRRPDPRLPRPSLPSPGSSWHRSGTTRATSSTARS